MMTAPAALDDPLRPLCWLSASGISIDVLLVRAVDAVNWGMTQYAHRHASGQIDIGIRNSACLHSVIWPLVGPGTPRLHYSDQISAARSLLEGAGKSARAQLTLSELQDWWVTTVLADPQLRPASFRELAGRPVDLMRTAAAYIRRSDAGAPGIGVALTMLGAGALAVMSSTQCNNCGYRIAAFGTYRCPECSRAKVFESSARDLDRQAHGRRSARLQGAFASGLFRDGWDDLRLSRSFAQILYGVPQDPDLYAYLNPRIDEALSEAPLVSRLLPATFVEEELPTRISMLQRAVDPNEWDYMEWPKKILGHQAWLFALNARNARRDQRGPTDKTSQLGIAARELLDAGASKAEVADRLGISRSHLSQVLRRTCRRRSTLS